MRARPTRWPKPVTMRRGMNEQVTGQSAHFDVKNEKAGHSDRYQRAKAISGRRGNPEQAKDYDRISEDDERSPNKAKLFSDSRENEVRFLLRDEGSFGQRAVE